MLNAETYISPEEGIKGNIRTYYGDFYVEELLKTQPSGEGPNTWIFIEKIGRNTMDVVLDIARDLHISRKRMGFAGMKDKKAITRQWICISNFDQNDILPLKEDFYNVKFLKIKQNQKKLRIGQLIGNKFKILIRNIEDPILASKTANDVLNGLTELGTPNYYGWQRFGKPRTNTHLVGKALIENDLAKTVATYIGNPYKDEPDNIRSARLAYDEENIEKSYELMPTGMRYERMMLKTLIKEKKKKTTLDDDSYRRALFSLPKPLNRMFVHAYQSYLFNKSVSNRSKLGINKYINGDIIIDNKEHLIHDPDENIQELIDTFQAHPTAPLFGTKVPFAENELGKLEKQILTDENIKLEDFECPKIPKLGSHGLRRSIRFKIWDAIAKPTEDGVLVEFSIPKGCYATAVLREIMKNETV